MAIRLKADEPEAVFVDGVWVSPDQVQFVSAKSADELVKSGKAEKAKP